MNLSIEIIKENLNSFIYKAEIIENAQEIEGIRILNDNQEIYDSRYLYISSDVQLVQNKQLEKVIILTHKFDKIIILDVSIEQITNYILSIFEKYNSWEKKIQSLVIKHASLQELLEASNDIFENPCFIADMRGNIIAITHQYKVGMVNERWDFCLENMRAPIDGLCVPLINKCEQLVPDWSDSAEIYYAMDTLIGRYILIDKEQIGAFCIQENQKPLTESCCSLANIFCDMIAQLITTKKNEELLTNTDLLIEAIENDSSYRLTHIFKRAFGTYDDFFYLGLAKHLERKDIAQQFALQKEIDKIAISSICFNYKESTVLICKYSDMDILKKEILANPFLKFYKVGFSMPFRSIEQLSLRYRQASFAFSKGENEKYSINFCKEYAFNYLTEQLFQQSKALELLHPALNILEEYDLKKNTKLYETLYQYLINERNLVCTAKKLFIHRNSLLYRIQRISKLTKSDFDSDVERLHMLLSYEIMKNLR
jgi:hypothetical protein